MTADLKQGGTRNRRRVIAAAVAVSLLCVMAAFLFRFEGTGARGNGATVGEKVATLRSERTGLQARSDGEARVGLLSAYRVASLLTDALAARYEADAEMPFDSLPEVRQQSFGEVERLNVELAGALGRRSEAARREAGKVAERAAARLDQMAALHGAPVVLSYTPRFVPPRRSAGEITLAPGASSGPAPQDGALRLGTSSQPANADGAPAVASTVPRYAPDFAASGPDEPSVEVEIVGTHLSSPGLPLPVLTLGTWRGEATLAPERLRFTVPRSAFASDPARTTFAAGSLIIRRGSRTATLQLLFTVLPDRPGSFALDQKVRTVETEANTLVSPEILVRAPAGETRSVRRCFDPPPGWRFDKQRRRVVVVERLGWVDDIADATLNNGAVEFAPDEKASQICVTVVARPVTKAARTATIGRFETTLVRDQTVEQVVKSGIRALDWSEPGRVALAPGIVEWKLYVRLFDEIDREFDAVAPAGVPFLRIDRDADGKWLIIRADPKAEPRG